MKITSVERSLSQWLHKLVHVFHFGAIGGLVYVTVIGMFIIYIVSPLWLKPVGAMGSSAFSGGSFWNTTIPRYPSVHSNSTALVQDIVAQASSFGSSYDTTDQASPVYIAEGSTPTVTVTPWDCDGTGIDPDLATQWQAVPIPFYAQPSDGVAKAMIIYQPTTQTMWEMDQVQNIGGQWQACHGGRMANLGSTMGLFSNPYGTTDTGLAVLGGQITLQEFQQGVISHAIGLSLPNTSGGRSWPAGRAAGNGASSVPQGQRLQLDPSINVNSLGLSAAGRAVARAAQVYGFVVWDSGSTVGVRGENPKSYTTRGLSNPYGGSLAGALNGFPWHKLRALPANYGQFGPLPPNVSSFTTSSTTLSAGQPATFSWQSVDVDGCSIPGVASNLASTGSTTSYSLHSDTSYSLICSSPGGSTSLQLAIGVTGKPQNSPIPETMSITITAPQSGTAAIIPELATPEAAETVQKVIYYKVGNWLASVTKPPFGLDTTKLNDGKHKLDAQIYYRDGSRVSRIVNLLVSNKAEALTLPVAPTAQTSQNLRTLVNALGMTGAFLVMGLTSYWGWKRTHWL